MPEWLKGPDCKSGANGLNIGGSNPSPRTILKGNIMEWFIAFIVIFGALVIYKNWDYIKYMISEYIFDKNDFEG